MAWNDDLPKPEYKATLWGVPCYLRFEGEEPHVWGVGPISDWMVGSVIPYVQGFFEWITQLAYPQWEPPGFRFKIVKEYKDGLE